MSNIRTTRGRFGLAVDVIDVNEDHYVLGIYDTKRAKYATVHLTKDQLKQIEKAIAEATE